MDFIPRHLNASKRKNQGSKKVSKLSLKSHKQSTQSLSQSCSQVESQIAIDGGSSSFFSQPASSSSFEFNRHLKESTTTISSSVSTSCETLSKTPVVKETSSKSTSDISPLKEKLTSNKTNSEEITSTSIEQRTKNFVESSTKITSANKSCSAQSNPVNKEEISSSQVLARKEIHPSLGDREESSSIKLTKTDTGQSDNFQSEGKEDNIFREILSKVLSPTKNSSSRQDDVKIAPKINPANEPSIEMQCPEKAHDGEASSVARQEPSKLDQPISKTNDKSEIEVLTIDLISSPDEQLLEKENEKSRKPALGKLKQLKNQSVPLKPIKEVEKAGKKDETKKKISVVKKGSKGEKVKQTASLVDSDSDCEGAPQDSDDEEDYSNPLEGKSQFVTKLRQFERQEPKKFNHLSSPSKCTPKEDLPKTPEKKELSNKEEDNKSPQTTTSPIKRTTNDSSFVDFKLDPIKSTVNKESEPKESEESSKEKKEDVTDVENFFDQLPCPICNKQAGKNKRSHMKSCAFKNNVPTAQLIEALNLQKKQAEERIALGLPAVVTNPNQRVFLKKKGTTRVGKDANMELALALSRSLMEAQEKEELLAASRLVTDQADFGWQDCAIAASVSDPVPSTSSAPAGQMFLKPDTAGTVQLQKGGNTARRGHGRKANTGPSILLQTTQEERERRITQKVAMLLVGDEEQQLKEIPGNELSTPLNLVSSKLRNIQSKNTALWQLSAVSPSTERETFYVNKLSEFISPTKHEPGENLKHLSQIPGRVKSPERNTGDAVKDMSMCSFIDVTEPQPGTSRGRTEASSCSKSPRKSQSRDRAVSAVTNRQDYAGLSRDWSALLNSRTMSDITVYVNGEHELRAHKLVIFARCPAMLEDLALEMTPKGKGVREQMLLWSEVSRTAALAMLEFLYCDTTTRATTLPQNKMEELIDLATRYNVKELLLHLNMLSRIRSSLTPTSNEDRHKQLPKTSAPVKTLPCTPEKPQVNISMSPKVSPIKSLPCTPVKSTNDDSEPKVSSVRSVKSVSLSHRSVSPDLFDEGEEEEEEIDSRPDIAYLVSMMEKSQNQASTSQLNQTTSNIQNNDLKRRLSSNISPNSSSSSKKLCKDVSYCRKSLLSELESLESKHIDGINANLSPKSAKVNEVYNKSPIISPTTTNSSQSRKKSFSKSPKSPCISPYTIKSDDMNSSQLLDMLEKSPDVIRSNESPIISDVWDNYDEVGLMSASTYHLDKPKSPAESVITISSTSQASKVTSQDHGFSETEACNVISQHGFSETGNNTVINALEDDSFGVFEEGELSGLERAALNAYNTVVSPLRAQTPATKLTPNSEEITPMANYSIMESPALQNELDRYGIKKLKRHQAKLILRHIYNELHPVVPSTPNIVESPVTSRRGGTRVVRARGRRGGTSAVLRGNPHDISLSQPELGPSTSRQNVHNVSLSQPYDTTGSRTVTSVSPQSHDDDRDSSDSSNSSGDDRDSYSDLEEMEGGQVLENLSDVREAMSRLIAADSDLHHRMLMYEPVWVEEIQNLLKLNGFRCKPKPLLDYLDEHCITFRLPARQRTQKKRGSPKKTGTQRGLKSPSKKSGMSQRGAPRGRRRRAALP